MKLVGKSSYFIYLAALFATQVLPCDGTNYHIIDDSYSLGFCWRVVGESDQIQPNDRIVLAECDQTDDRQLFRINFYGYGGPTENVIVADFHPKLNDNLVVGVNELADHKRLRLQEPKANNSTQVFYFDEHGTMGIGTDESCMDEVWAFDDAIELYGHCLIVTSQGSNPSSGKIINLKTLGEILLKPNAGFIWDWMHWYLVGQWD